MNDQKKPIVFLDRDGTINVEAGYINHPDNFILVPNAARAVALLNRCGFLVAVITNQAGIARGHVPASLVDEFHEKMVAEFAEAGAKVDGIYVCPHHPDGKVAELAVACECRKPGTRLAKDALAELSADESRMYVVGDKHTDIKLAHNLGATGIMVETGYGKGEMALKSHTWNVQPAAVVGDLLDAVLYILEKEGRLLCEGR